MKWGLERFGQGLRVISLASSVSLVALLAVSCKGKSEPGDDGSGTKLPPCPMDGRGAGALCGATPAPCARIGESCTTNDCCQGLSCTGEVCE
jgi:hypothetical protein